MFDWLKGILQQKSNLNRLCNEMGVPNFIDSELEFIEGYCECVKPIAQALDRLHGEHSTFYGELLPTLFTVEKLLASKLEN